MFQDLNAPPYYILLPTFGVSFRNKNNNNTFKLIERDACGE